MKFSNIISVHWALRMVSNAKYLRSFNLPVINDSSLTAFYGIKKIRKPVALRSGDTIASEVTTEAWLLLIEN